jgi:hypothetical protein
MKQKTMFHSLLVNAAANALGLQHLKRMTEQFATLRLRRPILAATLRGGVDRLL